MRLLSHVLGFVLKKLGLLGALLLSLFLGYLLIQAFVPALQEAVAERDRLERVAEEKAVLEGDLDQLRDSVTEGQGRAIESIEGRIDAEIEESRRSVAEKKAELRRLREDERKVCGLVRRAASWVLPGNACEAAEKLTKKADEALDTIEGSLREAEGEAAVLNNPYLTNQQKLDRLAGGGGQSSTEREINNKRSELRQKDAEEQSLKAAQASGAGWVVNQWAQSWRWLAAIALLVLVMPVVVRVVSYFLLMPVVSRTHKPIHLAAGTDNVNADLRTDAAQRTLEIQLAPGEVLSARSEHFRTVKVASSQLLYDWASPFISFAAGLHSLSRIVGDEDLNSATLSTPDAPDSCLMRIDFRDHPGLVMRPRHVVGVIGTPELATRWRWGIASVATWQVRYIMFTGSGSLIVQGTGDVVATSPHGRSTRMEQNLMMGFDSRLSMGVNRTETFWPYLWGKTPLVDNEFTGHHQLFWQNSSADGPSNPIARVFASFTSAFSKLFGF
ncbi:hypothetical protein HMPREF0063_12085 [Aeromicrobium marinum DSM 15272]|uniref:Uncharacterized protein n=1 Tax=Aeromicrobium marinum DSM 15272 TaxID=585531 RepID=E2SCC3_9ACTN|nr:hypothetical protein [Aeromicrobium marinum]EFQ82876.1 hypothetical protein HMPREF0063_12085 [Aeromicrobium marinum DSM 15272]